MPNPTKAETKPVRGCIVTRFYAGEEISPDEVKEHVGEGVDDPEWEFDYIPTPSTEELSECFEDVESKTEEEIDDLQSEYFLQRQDQGVRVWSVEIKGESDKTVWLATEVVDTGYIDGATVHSSREALRDYYDSFGYTFT